MTAPTNLTDGPSKGGKRGTENEAGGRLKKQKSVSRFFQGGKPIFGNGKGKEVTAAPPVPSLPSRFPSESGSATAGVSSKTLIPRKDNFEVSKVRPMPLASAMHAADLKNAGFRFSSSSTFAGTSDSVLNVDGSNNASPVHPLNTRNANVLTQVSRVPRWGAIGSMREIGEVTSATEGEDGDAKQPKDENEGLDKKN